MPQPTIINAGNNNVVNDTTSYDPAEDAGASRTFNGITIPANANTVCFLFVMDVASSSFDVSDISATGGGVEIFDFEIAPDASGYRTSAAMAMDVSSLGAFTSTITVSLSAASAAGSILGVVCTDGFIENVTSTSDRATFSPLFRSYSKNSDNNILCQMHCVDGDYSNALTISSGTELFNAADSKTAGSGVYAISQATSSADVKTISYTAPVGADTFDVQYVFASQKNPFEQQGGGLIRNVIRNV